MPPPKPHGHFLAGEAGELAGVSGTTVGQWARWGYIRSSQSAGEPRVYSVEDVAEAAMVRALLERGVGHRQVRAAVSALDRYGPWPLSQAPLATARLRGRPRILLCEEEGVSALSERGWQLMTDPPPRARQVPLRLRAGAGVAAPAG
jgi:DNA-binding transcriptional MerR regulator